MVHNSSGEKGCYLLELLNAPTEMQFNHQKATIFYGQATDYNGLKHNLHTQTMPFFVHIFISGFFLEHKPLISPILSILKGYRGLFFMS